MKTCRSRLISPPARSLTRQITCSKLEFPEGAQVRLVRIGDYDICACSATHVRSTGEIGVIKITSFARYKGGVRIHMLAGRDAFEEYVRSYSA